MNTIFYFIPKFHLSNSMLRYILSSLMIVNLISFSTCQIRRRQNYQIDWNSSNIFFQSKPSVLNVRLGDSIDFLCPSSSQSSSIEYNTLYLVSEIDYNLCFTEHYQPLIRCDQPYSSKPLIYTLSISKYLPYPNMPEFVDGRSYYFISTSTGDKTGLNQTYDGLCLSKNLRLIVDVQKYYRRYSKYDNAHYRSRVQKQTLNHTNEQLISSNSSKLSFSLIFILLSTFVNFSL
mgnify:CR=1 FL=1